MTQTRPPADTPRTPDTLDPAAALWSADEARIAAQGTLRGASSWFAHGVTFDSREVVPGDLFVALKGESQDGHAFVGQALDKGAAAALVSTVPEDVAPDAPLLRVPDTLQGLRDLGEHRRAAVEADICAITGSVGKTGTTAALRAALSPGGPTHAPVKSFNNHVGVPLTLSRMPRDSRYGVFEIGMNHAGEITPLTKLVRPDVAIVTTVGPVHLEFFENEEGIADAKAEIFQGLEPGGAAIINRDNRHFERLKAHADRLHIERIVPFGAHEEAQARLIDVKEDGPGSCVTADILGRQMTFYLAAPGRHLAENALAVLAAVACLGADLHAAADALAGLGASDGRGRRHVVDTPAGPFTLVDESYNANPASMSAALATLGTGEPAPGGRRIAVLGDMLELGPGGPQFHEQASGDVVAHHVDLVFCAGPLMRHLWDALEPARRGAYAETSAALLPQVSQAVRAGDVVMIKGSLGSRMRPIVDELLAKHGKQEGRVGAVRNAEAQSPAARYSGQSEGV